MTVVGFHWISRESLQPRAITSWVRTPQRFHPGSCGETELVRTKWIPRRRRRCHHRRRRRETWNDRPVTARDGCVNLFSGKYRFPTAARRFPYAVRTRRDTWIYEVRRRGGWRFSANAGGLARFTEVLSWTWVTWEFYLLSIRDSIRPIFKSVCSER